MAEAEDANEIDAPEPLVSYRAMFDAEVAQAIYELQRPPAALLASGAIAGACVGISVLILGLIVSVAGEVPSTIGLRFMFGGIYAVGFIMAILARSDLFTEYTTIAILPVLTGAARVTALARLWALIYLGNLIGGFGIGLVGIALGPAMGVYEAPALGILATHLAEHAAWTICVSAALAGWLMGLLSWLIAGGRDTTSQILFITLIGTVIGTLGLHHSITGGVELFVGAIADPAIGLMTLVSVLFWTTLGNAAGGILFAYMIQQGVQVQPRTGPSGDREEGRERRRTRRT